MVTQWALEAFHSSSTMESLRSCPIALVSLDGKIMTGLQHTLRSSKHLRAKLIDQNINLATQETLERCRTTVGGRQGIHILTKQFVTSDNSESFLGIEHLSAAQVMSDDSETFWITWKRIEGQLHPLAVTPKRKEQLLYRSIHEAKALPRS